MRPRRPATAPKIAIAFDSVPPEVRKTSPPAAPINAPIASRAPSMARRARCPSACTEDGFPKTPAASVMAATTSGSSRVEALLSR